MISKILPNRFKFLLIKTKGKYPNKLNTQLLEPSLPWMFDYEKKGIPMDSLIRKMLGIFSKEDIAKIEKKAHKLSTEAKSTNMDELLIEYNKSIEKLLNRLKKRGFESSKNTKDLVLFSDNTANVTSKAVKKIKKILLNVMAEKRSVELARNQDILITNPSIKDWYPNVNCNMNLKNIYSRILVHPVEFLNTLVGEPNKQEIRNIDKQIQKLKKKNISDFQVIQEKETLLEEINSSINQSDLFHGGELSDKKLSEIRQKGLKYKILDEYAKDKVLFSKDVETVISCSSKKLSTAKTGEYIDTLGLVLKKETITDRVQNKDIDCCLIFNKNTYSNIFKLLKIDKEYENKLDNFKNEYEKLKNECKDSKNINLKLKIEELNKEAKKIIEDEEQLYISRMQFSISKPEDLKAFFDRMPNQEKVDKIIEDLKSRNINKIACIQNFLNLDPKRFVQGGRKVGIPLVRLLKDNRIDEIYIVASAFGRNNAKSPLPIYLRAGFEPIFPSKEEILNSTSNHKSFDPKTPVFMYLPKNSLLSSLIH